MVYLVCVWYVGDEEGGDEEGQESSESAERMKMGSMPARIETNRFCKNVKSVVSDIVQNKVSLSNYKIKHFACFAEQSPPTNLASQPFFSLLFSSSLLVAF